MKCPYCAEEIKEEAIFCRYCKRDLLFFKPMLDSIHKPMLEKISSLEHQISEVAASLEALRSSIKEKPGTQEQTPLETPSPARNAFPFWQRTLIVVLPALAMVIVDNLENRVFARHTGFTAIDNPTDIFALVLFLAIPISTGIWVGIKRPRRHPKTYIFLGMLMGVIVGIGVALSDSAAVLALSVAMEKGLANLAVLVGYLLLIFGLYILMSATLFIAGVLFGNLIRRRRSPSEVRTASIRGLAEKIVSPESASFERTVKLLEELYAPTLGFLGTLLTFIGTYLTLATNLQR